MSKSICFRSVSAEKTMQSGQALARRLLSKPDYARVVFLQGDLGTGKTTFIRGLANGLQSGLQVRSPSFSIVAEYDLGERQLVHVDLYRLDKVDLEIEEYLREKINNPQVILVVEWAEKLGANFVKPEQRIEITLEHGAHENERVLRAQFFDRGVPSEVEIAALTDEFKTPQNVQAHEQGVARVTDALALALYQQGYFLDLDLVHAAAALHDLVRIVNFEDFSRIQEEATPEKEQVWRVLHDYYHQTHHGDAAAEILQKKGFFSCADVIAQHKSIAIFEGFNTLEEEVVYLADKKVAHDQIVTMKERFREGRTRHNRHSSEEHEKLKKATFELADKLFAMAGLSSERELDEMI